MTITDRQPATIQLSPRPDDKTQFILGAQGSCGTASIDNATAQATYVPDTAKDCPSDTDVFTVKARSGSGPESLPLPVSIHFTNSGSGPSETFAIPFNTEQKIQLHSQGPGNFKFILQTPPKCGTVTIGEDDVATYTPSMMCVGRDQFSFTMQAVDPGSTAPASTGTVNLFVAPMLPGLIAGLFGGIAGLWGLWLWFQVRTLRRTLKEDQENVGVKISAIETQLRQAEQRPDIQSAGRIVQTSATQPTPAAAKEGDVSAVHIRPANRTPEPVNRAPEKPRQTEPRESSTAASQSKGTIRAADPQPPLEVPRAPEPVYAQQAIAEPAPVVPAAPAEPAPRWKKTEDLLSDYNSARALGQDGQDFFLSSYRWTELSCVNLDDRRANPTAELRLVEAIRGVFLGVEHKGQMLVVPAMDKHLGSARKMLEGVFDYRTGQNDATRLTRPGTLKRNGVEWLLTETGEIS